MPEVSSFLDHADALVLALLQRGIQPAEIAELRGVHMNVVRYRIARLRHKLGAGSIADLLQRARLPMEVLEREFEGRSKAESTFTKEPAAAQQDEYRANLEFYRLLGPELPGTSCRIAGCQKGTIGHSVLCREHHYVLIRHYACPFQGDA